MIEKDEFANKMGKILKEKNIPYSRITKRWGDALDSLYDVCIPSIDHIIPKEGEIFLDVGCGKLKMPEMIGIDKRKLEGVDVVCDLEKEQLPYKDNTLDFIHTSMLLEHIQDLYKVMTELWRVLKIDGKLFIIVPYWESDISWDDVDHKRHFTSESFRYFDRTSEAYRITDYEEFKGDFRVLHRGIFRPGHVFAIMEKKEVK